MAEVIRMPKMSDTMEEGVIASWLVKEGDEVSSGDILAEVETDKATMELESYEDGTILHIGIAEKSAVPVDGIIAIIGEKGEDFQHLLNGGGEEKAEKKSAEESSSAPSGQSNGKANADVDLDSIPASVIRMPKMSDTMEEGVMAGWLVKVGDEVSSGDVLAEVETDKATMELESYEDGTILYIGVKEGDAVPVDGIIAIIGEKGTDYEPLLKQGASAKKEAPSDTEKPSDTTSETKSEAREESKGADKTEEKSGSQTTAAPPTATTETTTDGGRIKASPLAKKIAADKGYNLADIKGSGENGRIVKRDVEAHTPRQKTEAAPAAAPATTTQSVPQPMAAVGEEKFTEQPVGQMRKTIAKRLAESKFTAPHFYLTMEINMDKAVEARKSINEVAPVKISFNDMVIKAVAAALRRHPKVNSAWLGDKIRLNQHIHIGVAVAVEEGLLVPVVRFADNKSLSQISEEVKALGNKAKEKKLQPADWEGNTFTISNLGMFGIEEFTAIINPPDSCILAVGGIKQTPVVKDGEIKIGQIMKVTLSCDHRVVDGVVGSSFLQTFKQLLEDPVRILV